MTDELVEIVARALCKEDGWNPDRFRNLNVFTPAALATLRAIEGAGYKVVGRDMTWPMRKAVLDATSFTQAPTTDTIWQAAFDAAPTVGEVE